MVRPGASFPAGTFIEGVARPDSVARVARTARVDVDRQGQTQGLAADEPLSGTRRAFVDGQQPIDNPALKPTARIHREQARGHAVEALTGIGIGDAGDQHLGTRRRVTPGAMVMVGQKSAPKVAGHLHCEVAEV